MKTIEEYAIELVVDGATSFAEDDMNEDDDIADGDHRVACDLAETIARAIKDNPEVVLALAGHAGNCDSALLPLGNGPVEPCTKKDGHDDLHQNAQGVRWADPADDED